MNTLGIKSTSANHTMGIKQHRTNNTMGVKHTFMFRNNFKSKNKESGSVKDNENVEPYDPYLSKKHIDKPKKIIFGEEIII